MKPLVACLLALVAALSGAADAQVIRVPRTGVSTATVCVAPGVPQNLQQTAQTSSTITVTWSAPLVAPCAVVQYQVSTSLDGVTYTTFATYNSSTFTSTITNLATNTTYYIQVVASNAGGFSSAAIIQGATTPPTLNTPYIPGYVLGTFPSGQAPTNTAGAGGATSWGITWLLSPPDVGADNIATSYKVYLGGVLNQTLSTAAANCNNTSCSTVITGLTASTGYTTTVSGCNLAVTPCSAQTPSLSFTTSSTPAQVTNLGLTTPDPLKDTQCCNPWGVSLSWSTVSGAVAYLVEYSTDGLTWYRTANNPTAPPYITVANALAPFMGQTFYLFRVSWCQNSACSPGFTGGTSVNNTKYYIPPGQFTNTVSGYFGWFSWTLPPSPMGTLTVSSSQTRKILVQWSPAAVPPSVINNAPLGYSVGYVDQANPNNPITYVLKCNLTPYSGNTAAHASSDCATLGPTATSPAASQYTITGLTSGHTYIVYVNPFNCATAAPNVVGTPPNDACNSGTGGQVPSSPITVL